MGVESVGLGRVVQKDFTMTSDTAYTTALAKRKTVAVNRQPVRPKPESIVKRIDTLAIVDAYLKTAIGSPEAIRVLDLWRGGRR